MEGKFKDFTADKMVDYIRYRKAKNDDEWMEIQGWIDEFLANDPPEEEKRRFVPLGWAECVYMICDGITRWKNSICIHCGKMQGHERCEIYPGYTKDTKGIPAEIWAHEDAQCPYFEPRQGEDN